MFAKTAAFPLFATPVWGFDLPEDQAGPINARLLDLLERWFTPRPALKPGETWQTTHDLHEREEFAPLLPFVQVAVDSVLEAMAVRDRAWLITGCWANINPAGGFHPPHIHPNNLISAAYYLKIPREADAIVFHDPRPQAQLLKPVSTRAVPETQAEIQIEAKPGRMVLFPSWLRHSVRPNYGNEERVSISFNVMLDDYAATNSAPMWRGFREDGSRA